MIAARTDQHVDETPSGSFLRITSHFVKPIVGLAKPSNATSGSLKTPKFPSRQRHLAIKRKKSKPKRDGRGDEVDNDDSDEDDDVETLKTEEDDINALDGGKEANDEGDSTVCNGDCSNYE